MALDVFMQEYSCVRRNFFWNMGFRLLGSLFLYGRIRKAGTRGRKTGFAVVFFLPWRSFDSHFSSTNAFCVSSYYFLCPRLRDVLELANWSGNGRGF